MSRSFFAYVQQLPQPACRQAGLGGNFGVTFFAKGNRKTLLTKVEDVIIYLIISR
jgi:hypothetical protein